MRIGILVQFIPIQPAPRQMGDRQNEGVADRVCSWFPRPPHKRVKGEVRRSPLNWYSGANDDCEQALSFTGAKLYT